MANRSPEGIEIEKYLKVRKPWYKLGGKVDQTASAYITGLTAIRTVTASYTGGRWLEASARQSPEQEKFSDIEATSEIFDALKGLGNPVLSQGERHDLINNIYRSAVTIFSRQGLDKPKRFVLSSSPKDVIMASRASLHDISNDMTFLTSVPGYRPDFFTRIPDGGARLISDTTSTINELDETLSDSLRIMQGNYPKSTFSAYQLKDEMVNAFSTENVPVEEGLNSLATDALATIYFYATRSLLKRLAKNIAQNERRAADKSVGENRSGRRQPVTLVFSLSEERKQGRRHFGMSIEDANGGFPSDILEHGFQYGRGEHHGGLHIGMADITRLMKKGYGAKYKLENIRREDGSLGAKQTYYFPAKVATR